MTLFTNVLQNPQDARTRSDIRLMHQVVSFLSSIAVEEETGGVKRMLEVCVEFERIAKIVVDKSDKETHSRRKRKNPYDEEQDEGAKRNKSASPRASEKTSTPQATPQSVHTPAPTTNGFTPGFSGDILGQPFSPSANGFSPNSNTMLPNYVPQPGDFPNMFTEFSDINQFGATGVGSPGMSNFQQSFSQIGQDLWQMPVASAEWEASWGIPPENFGQTSDNHRHTSAQPHGL